MNAVRHEADASGPQAGPGADDVVCQLDRRRSVPVDHRSSTTRRQTCKACGRPDKFDFNISDEVWTAVVPEAYRNRVLCLYCFDDFAAARGIDYARALRDVWFAGDRAVFQFVPVTRVTV